MLSSLASLGPEELADIHGDADTIYEIAGEDPYLSPRLRVLAERVLSASIGQVMGLPVKGRCGAGHAGSWIEHRRGLGPAQARMGIAHEIAELWYCTYRRIESPMLEPLSDGLAAALVATYQRVRLAVRRLGLDIPLVARWLIAPQLVVLIRVAQVLELPLLLLPRCGEPVVMGAPFVFPEPYELLASPWMRLRWLQRVDLTEEAGCVGLIVRG